MENSELTDAMERLKAMAYDRGETWDLSENDQKALRICLKWIEDAGRECASIAFDAATNYEAKDAILQRFGLTE
jgi:hypothetical protein